MNAKNVVLILFILIYVLISDIQIFDLLIDQQIY